MYSNWAYGVIAVGPVIYAVTGGPSMYYKNCKGKFIEAHASPKFIEENVSTYQDIFVPSRLRDKFSRTKNMFSTRDLQQYLTASLQCGDCIIVKRSTDIVLVRCAELEYVVDVCNHVVLNISEF